MNTREVMKEAVGISVTASRYLLAERMAHRVKNNQSILGNMVALVGADMLDGVILRRFDMDTPARRVADGVVDHASVARVSYEVAKKYPESQPYIAMLASRAILAGGANLLHLFKTSEVTKGHNMQRSTNIAMAAFCLVAVEGNTQATHLAGVLASGIATVTAPAHFQNIGETHDDEYRIL